MAKQPKRYVDETAPDDPGAPSLNEEPRDALDFDEHRDERSGRCLLYTSPSPRDS